MSDSEEIITPFLLERLARQVDEAGVQLEREHPLDSLLKSMQKHGWQEEDPMVLWVKEAMLVPYPMPRWEARERGLLPG